MCDLYILQLEGRLNLELIIAQSNDFIIQRSFSVLGQTLNSHRPTSPALLEVIDTPLQIITSGLKVLDLSILLLELVSESLVNAYEIVHRLLHIFEQRIQDGL